MTTYDYAAYSTGISTTWLLIVLVFAVLQLIGLWKMFEKAGENGWKCLIPIYSQYIMYKLFWGNGWLFLLMLIPIVNFIVLLILMWKMAVSFGGGIGYFLGLLFLPFMYVILGFGSAKYVGPGSK